jgi:hypothetical protein
MKALQLTPLAKVRIWCGRATHGSVFKGSVTRRVDGAPEATPGLSSVALEAFVPRGARAEYGLLGFTFEASAVKDLDVEVQYSEGQGDSWPESLAKQIDDVRLGLPREYANRVLDAASAFATRLLPPGRLKVVEAAHGLVGSSGEVFRRLTIGALSLLQAGHRADDEVIALLEGILVG